MDNYFPCQHRTGKSELTVQAWRRHSRGSSPDKALPAAFNSPHEGNQAV